MKRIVIILLFSLLILLFSNCEKEPIVQDISNSVEVQSNIKYLTSPELPEVVEHLKRELKDVNYFNPKSGGSNSVENTYIDYSKIMEVVGESNTTNYTFNLGIPNAPYNEFYNLIIRKKENGKLDEPYVIRYVVKPEAMANFEAHNRDFRQFKGYYSTHKFSNFFNSEFLKNYQGCGDGDGEIDNTNTGSSGGNSTVVPGDSITLDGGSTGETITASFGSTLNSSNVTHTFNFVNETRSPATSVQVTTVGVSEITISGSNGTSSVIVPPMNSSVIEVRYKNSAGCTVIERTTILESSILTSEEIECPPAPLDSKSESSSDCPELVGETGVLPHPVLGPPEGYALNPADGLYYDLNAITNNINSIMGNNLSASQLSFLGNASNIVTTMNIQRFLVDNYSQQAIDRSNDIINSGVNNILASPTPYVKYPEGSDYATKYPKLTALLKNELPKIAENTKIIDAINEITSAPKETIKEALKWGKGPVIKIEDLTRGGLVSERLGAYRGHIDDDLKNIIFLDITLVNDYENAQSNTNISDTLAFLIAVTVLHEYNHLGDIVFGDSFWNDLYFESDLDPENEAGILFEEEIFGEAVWRTNAGLILTRTGGFNGN